MSHKNDDTLENISFFSLLSLPHTMVSQAQFFQFCRSILFILYLTTESM